MATGSDVAVLGATQLSLLKGTSHDLRARQLSLLKGTSHDLIFQISLFSTPADIFTYLETPHMD